MLSLSLKKNLVPKQVYLLIYSQPVSLRRLIALERSLTQPRKPAPCFLWIFLWFHTLIVIESDFPMYLKSDKKSEKYKCCRLDILDSVQNTFFYYLLVFFEAKRRINMTSSSRSSHIHRNYMLQTDNRLSSKYICKTDFI